MQLSKKVSIWFTGYPSSGKTTCAKKLKKKLDKDNVPSVLIDGDEIRKLIFNNKNYDKKSRFQSSKKYLRLAKLILKTKLILIVSTNHHTQKQRKFIKSNLGRNYLEVWMKTPLIICKKRDTKKLYSRYKAKKIKNIVGCDLKFEKPISPDLIISHSNRKISNETKIIDLLIKKKIILNER